MSTNVTDRVLFKDEVLDQMSRSANVAQFVSFGLDLVQRFARIRGWTADHVFDSPEEAIQTLLRMSPEGLVNIRSYRPEAPEGAEFLKGLGLVAEVLSHLRRLASAGLYTIVNETVDVNDGGVSGVLFGNVIEFAPGGTPRSVEAGDIASLPRRMGLEILETVYGFQPALDYPRDVRVEFSLHPCRRGFAHDHTIIWEAERADQPASHPGFDWPNAFSRLIGDKAFGLLVSDAMGFLVPRALVIPRRIAAFQFGTETHVSTKWLRTCPREPRPGQFSTIRGWADPFDLLAREDPSGDQIASILVQDEVSPIWSGAALTSDGGEALIEGVRGPGDRLMIGGVPPEDLPPRIIECVRRLYRRAVRQVGSIRLEWVYDDRDVWALQLQQESSRSRGHTIVPGRAHSYQLFDVRFGIEQLRELVSKVKVKHEGVILIGRVGMTSHLADILRRARIPSKLVPTEEAAQRYIRR